jgi:hypothetical protein
MFHSFYLKLIGLKKEKLNTEEFSKLPKVIKKHQRKLEKKYLQKNVPKEVVEAEVAALKNALVEKNITYVPPPKKPSKSRHTYKKPVKAKKKRLLYSTQ